MLTFLRENFWQVVLALAVHVVLLGLLIVSLGTAPSTPMPQAGGPVVKAVAVNPRLVQRELDKLRENEARKRQREQARQQRLAQAARKAREERQQEQRRLAKLKQQQAEAQKRHRAAQRAEQQRLAQLKQQQDAEQQRVAKLKQQQAALAKQHKEEQQRLAQAEAKRKAEEQKQKAAEAARKRAEQKRKAEEAARKREAEQRRQAAAAKAALDKEMAQAQAQQEAQLQRQLAPLRQQYMQAIAARVERNWIRQPGVAKGTTCVVSVHQLPGGIVASAQVASCSSGGEPMRRSVETAVLKSSPLPQAPDPAVFDRDLQFTFIVQ